MVDLSRQAPPEQTRPVEDVASHGVPVSLVIPVRDEQATLDALFSSIDGLRSPPSEVLFVDGGSSDSTADLIRQKAAQDSRYTLVLADGKATPGRGRNIGVAAARCEWVAMTDAGITLEPTWLDALWAAHLADPQARIVYGNVEFDIHSSFEECAVIAYGTPKRLTAAGPCRGPSTQSFMVHKRAFHQVGGFPDLRAGEDEMFIMAIEAADVRTAWAPTATVWWRIRPDMRSTAERFRLYSYSYAIAGRQAFWHRSLARSYVPVGIGLVLAAVRSRRWLLLSTAVIVGRVAVRMRRHHGDHRLRRPGPVRAVRVAGILLVSDAATARGWWQARRQATRDRRSPSATAAREVRSPEGGP